MATFTNQTKNGSSFSNQSKNTSSFSNQSKTTAGNDFLLMEDNSYILLEIGDKIILEQSVAGSISWSNLTKN